VPTAAKLRADVSRLARQAWSASKKAERLQDHLMLYIAYNNGYRLPKWQVDGVRNGN
jgi:hypothetical protein